MPHCAADKCAFTTGICLMWGPLKVSCEKPTEGPPKPPRVPGALLKSPGGAENAENTRQNQKNCEYTAAAQLFTAGSAGLLELSLRKSRTLGTIIR